MIDFTAFSDELQKIAQYDPNRKAKAVGGLAGAGVGAAAAHRLAGRKIPPKARLAATLSGALLGGLGGRDIGEGAATVGRGLRMTAAQTRYAMR